jgi:putative transposase
MARKAQAIIADESQIIELKTISRSQRFERRYVDRSKVVLLSLEGKTLDQIESETGLSRRAVNKWRNRFRKQGLQGLNDEKRPGKKPVISAETKAMVVQKACEKPTDGSSAWSQRRIAKEMGISQSKVCDVLKEADLKPHKTEYWCGKSPDPEFETKMATIVGLYMNPPENALVICVDEKTQIQALDRTQPELPLKPGLPKRLTTTYKRNGTVSLIAALAVHTGEVTGQTIAANNAENFLKFLKKLDRTYRHKTLHIIADNLAVHKDKRVQDWLKGKRKIILHFTPTYSSWLNQVEIWFSIMSKDVLKNAVWHSKQQLVDQLTLYIETYNQTRAKPFQWTYTGQPLKK